MKRIIALAVLVLGSSSLFAQSNFELDYIVAIPSGDTEEFVNETSFRGGSLAFSYKLDPQFEVGASLGWQNFADKKGFITTEEGTTTITTNRRNYINSTAMYATAKYLFGRLKENQPFIALGIGTQSNNYDEYFGVYQYSVHKWQFALQPQLGFRKELNYNGFGIQGSARYNYAFEAGSAPSLSYYSLSFGLIWMN